MLKLKRTKLNNKSQASLESANATEGGRNKKKGKAKKRTFVELKKLIDLCNMPYKEWTPKNWVYLREY